MKIIDCFIFYNELDLLKYRLSLLNDYVDFFVIVESTHTFTGKEKPLLYNENKHNFEEYKDKILHIVVNDFPYKYPHIDFSKNHQWENEYHQRNYISKGISNLSLLGDDVIIISDVDEIPDPTILSQVKKETLTIECCSLEQDFYYYNLKTKIADKWYYSKILTYKNFVDYGKSCQELRMKSYPITNYPVLKNGGWHLSYFGDEYFIQNKLMTFAHQEFNNENFTNVENIKNRLVSSTDIFDRHSDIVIHKIPICENNYLPPNCMELLNKFT